MKKNYLLLFLFALFLTNSYGQDVGCIEIVANTPLAICQPGQSTTIRATPPINKIPRQTTSYAISSAQFSWRSPDNVNDVTSITTDDRWSGVVPLRGKQTRDFNFCYFGEKYKECLIGDNGAVTFSILGNPDSPTGLYTPNSASGYSFNGPIPSGPGYGPPYKSAIMMLQDLNIANGPVPTTGINYFAVGTYPCRAFVANWQDVPLFGSCSASGLQSYQIVLFESTNIIEIHVRRRTSCSAWLGGRGLLGIQNEDGSLGYSPPNRNTGTWEVNPTGTPPTVSEAWRFTPSGALSTITYQWYQVGAGGVRTILPGQTNATLTVAPLATTDYCVVSTFASCDPAIPVITAEDCTTVTVGGAPGYEPNDITHCNTDPNPRVFDIGVNTNVMLGADIDPALVDLYYFTSEAAAQSGDPAAAISPIENLTTLLYTLPTSQDSQEIWVNLFYDDGNGTNCFGVKSFTISVRDCDAELLAPLTKCDDLNDNIENFNLNDHIPVIDAAIVADGLVPANYSKTFHRSLADSDNLATALTAAQAASFAGSDGREIYVRMTSTTDPTSYFVKYFTLELLLTPTATITGSAEICEGSTTTITITGTAGASVIYSDENNVQQPAVTLAPDAPGSLTGVYTFSTPAVVNANSPYVYTLVSVSFTDATTGLTCTQSLTQTAEVEVGDLPTAQIVTADTPICQGSTLPIQFQGTNGATVTYTDYLGATQTIALDGTGVGEIMFPTTLAPGTYTYTLVKASTSGVPPCEQNVTDAVTITVSPSPTAAIVQVDTEVCLGNVSRVRFTGTPAAIINYTLNTVPATVTLDATGDFLLLETHPAIGPYVYELVSVELPGTPNCLQPAVGTITVNVIAAPTATISVADPVICSGGSTTVTISGTPNTNVVYTINGNIQPTITLDGTGQYPAITQTLTADATYALVSVTTLGAAGCTAALTDSVTVTVNALPTATIVQNKTICSGTSTTLIINGTPNASVSYTINGAASGPALLDATGTFTITTPVLTATTTYRLVSITTTDAVPCSSTLNSQAVISIAPLPTASFVNAALNVCSNTTAILEISGTPNATVTISDGTTTYTVLLNGGGYAQFETALITAVSTYSLVSVSSLAVGSTPSCTASIIGNAVVTPIAAPIIFAPTPLEICDDNTDGRGIFILTDKDEEITGGPSTLLVSYHETPQNARDNRFPKQLAPYSNVRDASPEQVPFYIMYVRVEEPGGSQCPSFTQLRLIVNRTPQAVSPDPIEICDDATPNGLATFPDIRIREADMIADLDIRDTYTFSYFVNEADANAAVPTVPAINPTTNYNNTTPFLQTIYIKVENANTGCFKVVPMDLIVNPNPAIPTLPEYTKCDDNNPGDQVEIFDLDTFVRTEASIPTGISIKFYLDAAALASDTQLPLMYQNTISPAQTIIVKLTNESTGCSSTTTLTLRVVELPVIIIPAVTPTLCDADGNGAEQFPLDTLIPEITGGADYTITFHETEYNALNNLFPYTAPYGNLASGMIWIRAEDNTTHCISVAPLQLIVNPVPVVPAEIEPLVICDTNADGITRVDLVAHVEADLLALQPTGNYTINYYLSEPAATLGSGGEIIPPTNYLATNGDVIWVRITNDDTDCFSIISFPIVINPSVAFASVEYSLCDEALPNDGYTVFDLTTQNQYFGGNSGYTVAYYTQAGVLIDPANSFVNTEIGVQTLNVVITNTATTCVSNTTLTIRVEPLPNPRTDPQDITNICDTGIPNDGIGEGIDLTVNETYIANNTSLATIRFYYYTDLAIATADAAAGTFTNAIVDPTNYSGPSGTIYVLMTSNANTPSIKCSQMVQFDILVNPVPELGDNGVIKDFVACVIGSTGTFTFTLSQHNIEVIDDSLNEADYTFTYYDTLANAELGGTAGVLPNSYPNTSNPQLIAVRVVNIATGCFSLGTFNLIVDEGATATPIPANDPRTTTCDLDGMNDGITNFDLTLLDNDILGATQVAAGNYTIHYYENEVDALADAAEGITTTNPLAIGTPGAFASGTTTIYALVINRTSTTGCPVVMPIELTVNKLPEVTLEDGFFCVDPATLLPLNTYLLTATVDPAGGPYTFEWTKDGAPYVVLDNTQNPIEINEQGTYSVVVTNTVTGCVSEPSNDAIVTPTSAAIITEVIVTNHFTDNATITVVVDPTSLGDYEFKLDDDGAWQDSNIFSPVSSGYHQVFIRDKNNGSCQDSAPIEVIVVNYPKFFTPNGDGYNDTWNIWSLSSQLEAQIQIFDRYGKLIKQISPAGEGWDGTMNGQPLPSTDYWFKVMYSEDDVMKEFRAHFSMKR